MCSACEISGSTIAETAEDGVNGALLLCTTAGQLTGRLTMVL